MRRRCENEFLQTILEKRWTEIIETIRNDTIVKNYRDQFTKKYPLHFVTSAYDAPPEILCTIISLLLETQLSITDEQDKNGYTPLALACAFGLDFSCIRILLEANQSICKLLTKKGDTLLSLACQTSKTSYETIMMLLHHCPHSARLKNNMGWTPLHCAVWNDLSLPSLRAVIQSFPDALYSQTYSSEHTPLSLYWTNHSACSLSRDERFTISLLAGTFEGSTNDDVIGSCEVGILHKILSFPQYLPGIVDSILFSFPHEARIHDEYGRLPLHRVIENVKFPMCDILRVLSTYPEATGIADPVTGDIPLISAIMCSTRSFKWQGVLQEIFQTFPEAIYYRNKQNLLPFMVAAAYSSLDICYNMLRSAPELVYP